MEGHSAVKQIFERDGIDSMEQPETAYLESIQKVIERFGSIQNQFVQEKNGVVSLVKFIENIEGSQPSLSLKDPVMQKGKSAASVMVQALEQELGALEAISPPEVWAKFHENMVTSIKLQVEGYQEMMKVFEDNDIKHIGRGKDIVSKGMNILEGGTNVIQGA
ncbi:MAG: hypothetical protein RDV48_09620 [Candidatus Eremiobacteraeota bacterium]|nr:hypothetical protein [Candidatus Eremiobacteraeota bacterium]